METVARKWGNSIGVRIPHDIAVALGFSDGQPVVLEKKGNTLTLRSMPQQHPTLAVLLRAITASNLHKEVEWGVPQGSEVW